MAKHTIKKEAYIIVDTHYTSNSDDPEASEVWVTPKGKFIWARSNHAKNAWNEQREWDRKLGYGPKFNEQTRYIVKKVQIIAEE